MDGKIYFIIRQIILLILKYDNQNKLLLKSKKMTRHKININTLIENNNLIVNDKKGNITIYYLNNKKIVKKFNFYKKNLKILKKN